MMKWPISSLVPEFHCGGKTMLDAALTKEVKDKTPRELCESLTHTLRNDPHRFCFGRSWDRMELMRRGEPMLAEIDTYLKEHPPGPEDDEIYHISTAYQNIRDAIARGDKPPANWNP